ncbi:hypothetical protein DTO027B5_6856 [Paecilomyces variotii]|nr:hypothetical protein DTO021C3_4940 [Paecilomyces variotii]KAJ9294147.1 hypothetical protein DTO217A2_9218 [Paecilomyces variotii]KAJ9331398.1 hypothetical protein DTO027B5_6856 [Paecilomyces variotii]KAJ9350347.1 hypothetical protein DTO027B9_7054 [Paecilomyces variotii]
MTDMKSSLVNRAPLSEHQPLINSRGPCALEPVSATQHSLGDSIQKPSEFNRIGIAKLKIRPIITTYLQHFWNPFNELIRMQSLLSPQALILLPNTSRVDHTTPSLGLVKNQRIPVDQCPIGYIWPHALGPLV